jgi:ribonucleoside-diphosphate reductase alpha chain
MTLQEWLGKDNELGQKIWREKYQNGDETLDEWFDRVSGGNEIIRDLIKEKKLIFGGRIMANRGLDNQQSYSNCATQAYIPDDMDKIGNATLELMKIYQKGQGVGLCLSDIRPKGAKIGKYGNVSAGVVPFAKIFDNVTENTMAGSTGRRGALLSTLSVEHPDAMDFIKIKKNNSGSGGELLSTNISMYVPDRFMEHYIKYLNGEDNGLYECDYIVEATGEVIPHIVDTAGIMNAIIDTPEKAFDPALVFTDRFKDNHFFGQSKLTDKMSQNGCNEMIGVDGATCLLATIAVSKYIENPFTDKARVDTVSLENDAYNIILEMDKIIDEGLSRNPLEKQRHVASEWRNLGLGITSLADAFLALGIKYGSDESIQIAEEITKAIREGAIEASEDLRKTDGGTQTIIGMEEEIERNGGTIKHRLRNAALMAHAPSGTGSTMIGYSTGIEPIYRTEYVRSVTIDGDRNNTEQHIVRHMKVQELLDNNGNKDAIVSADQVDALSKVKILAAIQKHTDMCISNTTNFPKGTTTDEIKEMYVEAWKRKVTSMSIYVDGSLDGVLNEVGAEKKSEVVGLERGVMSEVPEDTIYIPKKVTHGCGQLKVMIGYSKSMDSIVDVYIIPKSSGGCTKNIIGEAILISQVLRLGGNLEDIKSSIQGVEACNSCVVGKMKGRNVDGLNCPNILIDTVISVKNEMAGDNIVVPESTPAKDVEVADNNNKTICPECGESLNPEGGCWTCSSCGYSKCG